MPDRGPSCVLTHGGAANVPEVSDGCAIASSRGLIQATALEMVTAAVIVLEDDPRMNAGTGSVIRIGGTVQMDAAVMDAANFGAVAVVEGIKNPVKLARAVYDSPHLLLAGAGAEELADRLGIARGDVVTDGARARYAKRKGHAGEEVFWRGVPGEYWSCDTVGAVARDAEGNFAAAGSTGGLWCALRGRVGDVPIPGAGLFVGAAGAVAATGVGEVIWREMIARRVHDAMAAGMSAQAACDDAVALVRAKHTPFDVGVIAVDATSFGVAVTGQMPWAVASGSDP